MVFTINRPRGHLPNSSVVSQPPLEDRATASHYCLPPSSPFLLLTVELQERGRNRSPPKVQALEQGMLAGHTHLLRRGQVKEGNIWRQRHSVLDLAHMNDALRQFSALS